MKNRKSILSTLWVFVIINMIYADILSLMDSESPIRKIMSGNPVPSGGLIAGAILMETIIVMIILSRVLSFNVNRVVTTIVCIINISLVAVGGHGSYYTFFAAIEILTMLFILWLSWKKPKTNEEGKEA